jgi:WD40 repeat protein
MTIRHVDLLLCALTVAILTSCSSPEGSQPGAVPAQTTPSPTEEQAPAQTAIPTAVPLETTLAPARQVIDEKNLARLQSYRAFTMPAAVRAVEFSPDGTLLAAACGDGESSDVTIWDVESGERVYTLSGHTAIVWDVTFSPDGRYLATSSKDQTARIWQASDGTPIQLFRAPGEVTSAAFTPDGRYFAYGGVDGWPNAAVWLVDTGTWNQVVKVEEGWNIPAILFTPDSRLMIAGGISRNVRAWYIPEGDQVYILYYPGQVFDLALSPDARTLAGAPCTESKDNTCQNVELWLRDAGSGAIQARIYAGSSPIQALRYAPGGRLLLTGSQDGMLKGWAMPEGSLLTTIPLNTGTIEDLAFSPGGELLATAGSDGTIRIWNAP